MMVACAVLLPAVGVCGNLEKQRQAIEMRHLTQLAGQKGLKSSNQSFSLTVMDG